MSEKKSDLEISRDKSQKTMDTIAFRASYYRANP